MSQKDIKSKSSSWTVIFSTQAAKSYKELPERVRVVVDSLVIEMQVNGPVRGNWKNYSKLGGTRHHCHLKGGRPTYVACWEVKNKTVHLVEIYYVGTHENAPY